MNDDLTPQPDRVSERWWDERAEAFEAWADSVSPADLEPADTSALQAITRLTDLRREIDAAILEAVWEARQQRRTWAEIGTMLGVSKQAAQHKYGPVLADSQPRSRPRVSALHDRTHRFAASIQIRTQPALVAHADWSKDPKKRWYAAAALDDNGRYWVDAPAPVGPVDTYLGRLRECAGPGSTVLAGFDFPIGLPARYAAMAGLTDFRRALRRLGRHEWSDFYEPARSRSDISIGRPFYPGGDSKGTTRKDLVHGLDMQDFSDLKRHCERSSRAEAMFWLVGSKQVGRSAISGWRDLLVPALVSEAQLSIWPFDGRLSDLLERPGVVVTETYPATTYRHLDLGISTGSKKRQSDRAADASTVRDWAGTNGVRLTKELQDEIEDGFGPRKDGEDPFDAVVGLLGMLDVVLGNLAPGEPQDHTTRIEGWMLGYSDADDGHRSSRRRESLDRTVEIADEGGMYERTSTPKKTR